MRECLTLSFDRGVVALKIFNLLIHESQSRNEYKTKNCWYLSYNQIDNDRNIFIENKKFLTILEIIF